MVPVRCAVRAADIQPLAAAAAAARWSKQLAMVAVDRPAQAEAQLEAF